MNLNAFSEEELTVLKELINNSIDSKRKLRDLTRSDYVIARTNEKIDKLELTKVKINNYKGAYD